MLVFELSPLFSPLLLLLMPLVVVGSDLIITGVIDGPLTGGLPKAVELYAFNSIPDLSLYGVGFANNGGGTNGQEFTFPAVSTTAGSYITVASEAIGFQAYFGSPPDYTTGFAAINGDDALELFFNGAVVDVFGDINVDGTGQPWEYMDGWAYRKSGSSPSGTTFQIGEWTFSGPNAIDVCSTNALCGSKFPSKSFGGPVTPTPAPIGQPTSAPGSVTKIHSIQGTGASVAITTPVLVEAIVTSLFYDGPDATGPSGFFLQEEDADADADPSTSEGIYVYCGTAAALAKCSSVVVGDLVQVSGSPVENFLMSQIDAATGTVVVLASNIPLPTPVDLTLPAVGSTKASGTFESVEGMLVRFPSTLIVSEYFNLARFGEIVLTEGSRPYQFTHDFPPSITGYAAFLETLATRRIILDDDNNFQNSATAGASDRPYPYPTQGGFPNGGLSLTNKMRGGDTINNLKGVMHWSFAGATGTDAWRLRPVQGIEYTFTSANPAPSTPGNVAGLFKVASFNVLNYFTTFNVRGANSADELTRQRAKIVAAMQIMDADVLGLIEIENSPNDAATIDLVNGLNNAVGAGTYDYVATGAIGTDQIKCAFIFKPATVNLVGNYVILDSSVDPRFIDTKNRPALIQTFEQIATGEKLTVAVNHFKSKGSACVGDPDLNDGQGNCAQTRADAALALADYLATDPTGSNDPDFLIIGDLNSYKQEDAIANLIAAGFTDLAEQFQGSGAYSYLFDGQIGYLDYALASGPLLTQVTGVSEWHVNADEIPLFDYNNCVLEGNEAAFNRESCANGDLYAPDALRSSDHDPVLIGMNLFTASGPTPLATASPMFSSAPSVQPSSKPSTVPSLVPSSFPSGIPSLAPSLTPSNTPSLLPSRLPTPVPTSAQPTSAQPVMKTYSFFGYGLCRDLTGSLYDGAKALSMNSATACGIRCLQVDDSALRGYAYNSRSGECGCFYDDNAMVVATCDGTYFSSCDSSKNGNGPVSGVGGSTRWACYRYA